MEEIKTSFLDSSHWSRELKCDVCFDYFKDPHTLACGHSFCICCLKRLAQTVRDINYSMSFSKVKFLCPTCRQGTLAKPVLKEDVTVSFVLRDVTDGWKKEKEMFCEGNGCTILRSVSSQTPSLVVRWPANILEGPVSKSEIHERIYPNDAYIEKAKGVTESDDSSVESSRVVGLQDYGTTSTDSSPDSTETESDWENLNNMDQRDRQDREHMNPNQRVDEDFFRVFWSPGRIAMTIFWFVYTALVTVIAHGFLPYMILYTLLFVLILYTESFR